jgi:hypothetical protein
LLVVLHKAIEVGQKQSKTKPKHSPSFIGALAAGAKPNGNVSPLAKKLPCLKYRIGEAPLGLRISPLKWLPAP